MSPFEIIQAIGSLATAGAVIFLIKQTKYARAAVTSAQDMQKLEMAREQRSLEVDDQRQAVQIVAWPVKALFQGKYLWGLLLVNASPAPVFDVKIARDAATSKGRGTAIPAISAKAQVLPPGRYFVSDGMHWPELMGDAHQATPIAGNADYMASVDFRDSSGLSWRRDANGRLAARVSG